MKFSKPDVAFLNALEGNKTKSVFSKSIVKYQNVYWYVKKKNEDSKFKEVLASKLANQLGLNAVNVIDITDGDIESIKKIENVELPEYINSKNTYLVKLAQSYSIDDLPIKNLDEAVASELVFSLWVRRRDTHLDNRYYIEDIPIFFDFHVAFGKKDVNEFFNQGRNENGYRDWGYAGCWRIKQCVCNKDTLEEIRDAKLQKISYHLVSDPLIFEKELDKYCEKIEKYSFGYLFNLKDENQKQISSLLAQTQKTIGNDCKILMNVLKGKYEIPIIQQR